MTLEVLVIEELKKELEKSEREGSISVACKKQSRQVQLTRVLERMTTTALLELLANCLPIEIFRLYDSARAQGPLLHDVGSGPVTILFQLRTVSSNDQVAASFAARATSPQQQQCDTVKAGECTDWLAQKCLCRRIADSSRSNLKITVPFEIF
eukprot:s1340_g29.t1